ncbi:HTH-type transcriptional activator IlvY [Shewanella japonica]|uniref:HTH-type transcriptional activator IlvY n=1 Tax=Shewanella japonica TaxID=93973 RepID=UPI002494883D|nr:HTH-type transcriptional activator IlvY [Shewanella japonica]
MDIRALKLYLHLCDSLHFGKTAEQNHVSPSTLSRAMQRLEEEVGCKLFERDNRSVSMTHAGTEFRRFAEQTLSEWLNLKGRIDPDQPLLHGRINLYCSVTAAYSHLPALLDRFRREHPMVEITLNTGDAANAVDEIQHNRADIAIIALPDSLPSSLHFAEIDQVPLHVYAPTINCQVQQMVNTVPIDWAKLPFIVPDHGPGRRRADNWFKAMGFKPNIYAQVSGQEAITSMVALGCGVSISPEAVVENSPVRERLVKLDTQQNIAPFQLGCCCKQKRTHEPILHAFLEVI